eukprot:scaffold1621_cov350-Prasinococcus_capsulatus_cf.AAC.20
MGSDGAPADGAPRGDAENFGPLFPWHVTPGLMPPSHSKRAGRGAGGPRSPLEALNRALSTTGSRGPMQLADQARPVRPSGGAPPWPGHTPGHLYGPRLHCGWDIRFAEKGAIFTRWQLKCLPEDAAVELALRDEKRGPPKASRPAGRGGPTIGEVFPLA